MSTTQMQDPQQDAMTGDLGLSPEELGWIVRVTPSILRKLTRRAGKAAGERALQSVHAELWECRKLLAEIPGRNRKAWLHTLVMRAVARAAERSRAHSRT